MRIAFPVSILALTACTSPMPSGTTRGASPATPGAIAAEPAHSARAADAGATAVVEAPEPPLAWGTRPPKDGILFPIVDGMCIHGEVQSVSGTPVFMYGNAHGVWSRGGTTTMAVIGPRGIEPQASFGFSEGLGWGDIKVLGGHFPDKIWALVDVTDRMTSGSELRFGDATPGKERDKWVTAVAERPESEKDDNDYGHGSWSRLGPPLRMADGSTLFPQRVTTRKAGQPDRETYSFRLLDPSGALVAKAKVPGPDLARLASRWDYSVELETLDNGEVLGISTTPKTKLVRWSPTKAVDDLPLPGVTGSAVVTAGKKLAYIVAGKQVFVYDGTKIELAKVSARIDSDKFRWNVGDDDTLWVALPNKTLLVEHPGGAVTEEQLPAFGSIYVKHTGSTGAAWLGGEGGQLFRRGAKGWEPVPIPPPPFGNAMRGPLSVEGITIVAPDDVYVNVRRVEKGWSWKDGEPYRAIYRTKRPEQVLRCQDVRYESTGKGVHAWPPSAPDDCTTPFITLLREEQNKPSKAYPMVGTALRGKKEFGETLSVVSFAGEASMILGIPMTDTAAARELAKHLSKTLNWRADVVCGRPSPILQELVVDVAKGTMTLKK